MNAKYYDQFAVWSKAFPQVQLVCDGTTSNQERLGAVACIELAVRHFPIQDDLIVIGGYVGCSMYDKTLMMGIVSKAG